MTEFDSTGGDNLGAELAASRDGEERGAIWREIILGDPQALEAEVRDMAETVFDRDVESMIEQVNGGVVEEAAAAAAKAQNPHS